MQLIDSTYFDGSLILPSSNQDAVDAAYDAAIAEYGEDYLRKVMGPTLYAAFTAGLAVGGNGFSSGFSSGFGNGGTITDRWKWIRDGVTVIGPGGRSFIWPGLINTKKRSPMANYVYWHYRYNNASQTTAIGEVISKAENATVITPYRKMVAAWNQMVDWNAILLLLLTTLKDSDGVTLYPEFIRYEIDHDLFVKQV